MIAAALACLLASAAMQEPVPVPDDDAPARGGEDPPRLPDDGDPEPEPEPEPRPRPPEPEPEREPAPKTPARTVTAAPFGRLGVGHREVELKVGGDLVIAPRCRDGGPACNGGRIGFAARFPVTETSTSGGGRTSVNALDGFAGGWRVGLVGDFIRDTTRMDGPAKFWMLTLGIEWGVQTFHWFPEAGPDETSSTRHSFDALGRFLYYIHAPRRHRVAPQVLVRYTRDYAGARPVGVLQPAEDGVPEIAIDRIIDAPGARPAFILTAATLFSVQRGAVLRQLGFGPALSWAAAGDRTGYDPFDLEHTLRLESWIYWDPAGDAYLEGPKTNVRIGVAPYVDAFLRRVEGTPQVVPGALLEVKVGVRGYEY